jgi:hypothetical protein
VSDPVSFVPPFAPILSGLNTLSVLNALSGLYFFADLLSGLYVCSKSEILSGLYFFFSFHLYYFAYTRRDLNASREGLASH